MRRFKPGVGIAQSGFIVKFDVLIGHISSEHATIHPGCDSEKDVGIGDRRHRNYLAARNHRRKIHKVLNGLHVEFLDLRNLRSQKPMPILVVAELGWNFKRDFLGLGSIFFYFFHAPRPQITIGVAQAGTIGMIGGRGCRTYGLVRMTYSRSESKQSPDADAERCAH